MNNCCNKPFNWQPWKGLPADLGEDGPSPVILSAGFTMEDSNGLPLANGDSIQQGLDLVLTNTSTGGATYQWSVDGTPVATTQDYSFTVNSVDYPCGATITVELVVTAADSTTDSQTQTLTVACA